MIVREPYQFVFKGYSVWLELEQQNGDLDKAIERAATDKSLYPIPEAHCTVVYGVSHMSEEQAKDCFRDKVVPSIKGKGGWPSLGAKGPSNGVSYNGVDGEEMDMSWMELSLHSSKEHEELVDMVHSCFYWDEDEGTMRKQRLGPWLPHVSIAYDNPKDTIISKGYVNEIFDSHKTLLSQSTRDVVGDIIVEDGG